MASTCRVTLRRFRPDLSGYTQVKSSGPVQALIAPKAEAVRRAADALAHDGDGRHEDGRHRVTQRRGKFDMGYYVSADNFSARYRQARDKTLTKALGSAGGGG